MENVFVKLANGVEVRADRATVAEVQELAGAAPMMEHRKLDHGSLVMAARAVAETRGRILAMRVVRAVLNCDLREAKRFVDAIAPAHEIEGLFRERAALNARNAAEDAAEDAQREREDAERSDLENRPFPF